MAEQYPTHLFSYRFGGASWTIDIKAKDAEEAQQRLRALAWATYDGVLIARVPVAPSRFVRFIGRLREAVIGITRAPVAKSN